MQLNGGKCSTPKTAYNIKVVNRIAKKIMRTVIKHTKRLTVFIAMTLDVAKSSFYELEQCREKKLAQSFNIAAQDSNPGSHSRESEALPLNHCAQQLSQLDVTLMKRLDL